MHPLPNDGEVVIGRDAACHIRLQHKKISRRHARLAVRGGAEVQVEDLGSTNGILVGDRWLAHGVPMALRVGEAVQLGPYTAMLFDGSSGPRADDGVPRAAILVQDPTPSGAGELVARIARSRVSVLVLGETGTGKEVLARTLHDLSGRAGPLVAINCATLGESLLESELFGHERGAFTGAAAAKRGLLEVSDGGTVLLDEIGDLSPSLQAKLLRALETRTILRVGGVQPIALDLRVIAATHRDLLADVGAGRFRRDLYFRLNGITLRLPPLRDRRDAIPRLAAIFLAEAAREQGIEAAPALDPGALASLMAHDWPGNVRELRQVIGRATLLAGRRAIAVEHLIIDAAPPPDAPVGLSAPLPETPSVASDPDAFLTVAKACRGNVTAMARALATSRSQIRRLAHRYGIDLGALR